jgi:hypothetical protein
MDLQCNYCQAWNFADESLKGSKKDKVQGKLFSICCGQGNVKPPENRLLLPIPSTLLSLISDETNEGRNFREHVRRYNHALATACFSATYKNKLPGYGPPIIRIHGQTYARVCKTIPTGQEAEPVYAQLYFIEPEEANQHRIQRKENEPCLPSVFSQLDAMLRDCNPYIKKYLSVKEQLDAQARQGIIDPDVKLVFVRDAKKDQRVYNVNSSDGIAVLCSGLESSSGKVADYVIVERDEVE